MQPLDKIPIKTTVRFVVAMWQREKVQEVWKCLRRALTPDLITAFNNKQHVLIGFKPFTWKLCRAVWTNMCSYRGWREGARAEKNQSLWHFPLQPTRQCMKWHLCTVWLNTLKTRRGKGWEGQRKEEVNDFEIKGKEHFLYDKSMCKLLTHPKLVNSLHQLLVRRRDFFIDVLVKAWLYS